MDILCIHVDSDGVRADHHITTEGVSQRSQIKKYGSLREPLTISRQELTNQIKLYKFLAWDIPTSDAERLLPQCRRELKKTRQ